MKKTGVSNWEERRLDQGSKFNASYNSYWNGKKTNDKNFKEKTWRNIISEILNPNNYAALSNNCVFEPIKIIQGIIKDANKYKKEAWILLMDISKVYDSVSSIMLEKNLERLKLPTKLINIVMDIINNRFNRVIVNKEVTDEYYVRDGLDQGEIWSPILWRIFYDVSLTRLELVRNESLL